MDHIEEAQLLLRLSLGASVATAALIKEHGLTPQQADRVVDTAYLLLEQETLNHKGTAK